MKTTIRFTLPAAHVMEAPECVLLGEFNHWNLEQGIYLHRQADGTMTAEVELIAGKDYQYRYLLSNGRWVNDEGEKITADLLGYPVVNCLVRVPEMAGPTPVQDPSAEKSKAGSKKTTGKAKPVVVKEDLTRVEGIGKKIEALLYKNKIYSYRQLSKTSGKSLKAILEAGGGKFSMHNPGTWPKQAKLAAAAKWEDLELLQRQLTGGK